MSNIFIKSINDSELEEFMPEHIEIGHIYGCDFTTGMSYSNKRTEESSRLYTSANYKFTASNSSSSGSDDFIAVNASPFMIRECCTRYNSNTGEQEVVSYEGDPTWDTDKINPEYNRMIEFPKFYYCRPTNYIFLISDSPLNKFKPSPMHYRKGVMYDKVYVSKYTLNSNYRSVTNSTSSTFTIADALKNLHRNGLYLMDYKVFFSLTMLMTVKYNNILNFSSIFGNTNLTNHSTTGMADSVLGLDGNVDKNSTDTSALVNLGLEFFLGDSLPTFINGLYLVDTTTTSSPSTVRNMVIDVRIDFPSEYPIDPWWIVRRKPYHYENTLIVMPTAFNYTSPTSTSNVNTVRYSNTFVSFNTTTALDYIIHPNTGGNTSTTTLNCIPIHVISSKPYPYYTIIASTSTYNFNNSVSNQYSPLDVSYNLCHSDSARIRSFFYK